MIYTDFKLIDTIKSDIGQGGIHMDSPRVAPSHSSPWHTMASPNNHGSCRPWHWVKTKLVNRFNNDHMIMMVYPAAYDYCPTNNHVIPNVLKSRRFIGKTARCETQRLHWSPSHELSNRGLQLYRGISKKMLLPLAGGPWLRTPPYGGFLKGTPQSSSRFSWDFHGIFPGMKTLTTTLQPPWNSTVALRFPALWTEERSSDGDIAVSSASMACESREAPRRSRPKLWEKPGKWSAFVIFIWCWATPLKNMSSSIGMMSNPIYGKIKNGNQTTNESWWALHI